MSDLDGQTYKAVTVIYTNKEKHLKRSNCMAQYQPLVLPKSLEVPLFHSVTNYFSFSNLAGCGKKNPAQIQNDGEEITKKKKKNLHFMPKSLSQILYSGMAMC